MSPLHAEIVAAELCERFGATSATRITEQSCTNAVYLLDGTQLVARISPTGIDADRTRAVTDVLADAAATGAAVVVPAVREPVIGDGWVATVWERVDVSSAPLDWFDVGTALASLHAHAPSPGQQAGIGRLDDLSYVTANIDAALRNQLISRADATLVGRWVALLDDALVAVAGPVVLSHGDFWAKNILNGVSGLVLCDPDNLAMGPATWDVASVLKQHANGQLTDDDLDRFFAGYGGTPPPPPDWMACVLGHDLRWTSWVVAHRDQTADLDRWADGMLARWRAVPLEVSAVSALSGLLHHVPVAV